MKMKLVTATLFTLLFLLCTPLLHAQAKFVSNPVLTTGALTCGAGTAGIILVHTTALQYCDNAGTPTLQYAAYGNSAGAATSLAISATTCTNQFVSVISAAGAGTCTTDTLAGAQHANQGTTTTLLHGNGSGNPSFGAVVSADLNITTSSCTNQFLTAISATGVGTCTTDTLAGAQHANQGTTTTLLHGNGSGNPAFSAVSLTADVSGVLPTANIALALANQTSIHGITAGTAAGDSTLGQVIAHGAKALDFASTATGACATVITDTATGAASTDVVIFNANASIKAVTGYVPASTGGFSIAAYPTTNTVSFEACNWTSGTVDPGSITVNWIVVR